MKPIVLASSSPRRKELLEQYKIPYIVDFEEIDEVLDENLALLDKLAKLAVDKGILVAARHPQEVVVSGDTLVCYNPSLPLVDNENQAITIGIAWFIAFYRLFFCL